MDMNLNGVKVSVGEDVIADMVRRRILGECESSLVLPHIGESFQGGIFAGIARGRDGATDYSLILGPVLNIGNWDGAMAGAAALTENGYKDWRLPYRPEQALLYANLSELFEKECYWSCEQLASHSDYAWGQLFGDGYQYYWRKDHYCRARAVRRGKEHLRRHGVGLGAQRPGR